jgi:hypothetical protein
MKLARCAERHYLANQPSRRGYPDHDLRYSSCRGCGLGEARRKIVPPDRLRSKRSSTRTWGFDLAPRKRGARLEAIARQHAARIE